MTESRPRQAERRGRPAPGPGGEAGAEQAPGFEEAIERLEQVVAELERGDLSLERALALYEEGVALVRVCARHLDQAEQRIRMLVEQHGDLLLVPAPELEGQGEEGRRGG